MQTRNLRWLGAWTLLLACNQFLHAAITSTGGAVVIIPPPPSVQVGVMESDTEIRVFNEQQNVTILQSDLNVDISLPGTSPSDISQNLSPGIIPIGTQISSYFVHFDKVGGGGANPVGLTGSLTFDADVLGIIMVSNTLNLTDPFPGLFGKGTLYPQAQGDRDLDLTPGGVGLDSNDEITLSADRRTVSLNLRSGAVMDEVRIVTAPEPSIALFSMLAFLLGRRNRCGPNTHTRLALR